MYYIQVKFSLFGKFLVALSPTTCKIIKCTCFLQSAFLPPSHPTKIVGSFQQESLFFSIICIFCIFVGKWLLWRGDLPNPRAMYCNVADLSFWSQVIPAGARQTNKKISVILPFLGNQLKWKFLVNGEGCSFVQYSSEQSTLFPRMSCYVTRI